MKRQNSVSVAPPVGTERTSLPHALGYHVKCSRCSAITVFDVSIDAVRIMCPSCNRRLTVSATVSAVCPSCGASCEIPHTLAGHSTACPSCHRPITLDPVSGRALSRHSAHHRRRRRSGSHHTFAVSEGAARSWILLAAAIATLIFVVATSMR